MKEVLDGQGTCASGVCGCCWHGGGCLYTMTRLWRPEASLYPEASTKGDPAWKIMRMRKKTRAYRVSNRYPMSEMPIFKVKGKSTTDQWNRLHSRLTEPESRRHLFNPLDFSAARKRLALDRTEEEPRRHYEKLLKMLEEHYGTKVCAQIHWGPNLSGDSAYFAKETKRLVDPEYLTGASSVKEVRKVLEPLGVKYSDWVVIERTENGQSESEQSARFEHRVPKSLDVGDAGQT